MASFGAATPGLAQQLSFPGAEGAGRFVSGGIWGGRRASFHHNLFAHCNSRTPRWNGTRYGAAIGSENCDFRNNVLYD